jgi:hypothetical protein
MQFNVSQPARQDMAFTNAVYCSAQDLPRFGGAPYVRMQVDGVIWKLRYQQAKEHNLIYVAVCHLIFSMSGC